MAYTAAPLKGLENRAYPEAMNVDGQNEWNGRASREQKPLGVVANAQSNHPVFERVRRRINFRTYQPPPRDEFSGQPVTSVWAFNFAARFEAFTSAGRLQQPPEALKNAKIFAIPEQFS